MSFFPPEEMYLTEAENGIIKKNIRKYYLFLAVTESQHFLTAFCSLAPDFCLNTEITGDEGCIGDI